MGKQLPSEVNKKVKTYHINMLKLYVERGRIEETATPGRRDIPGEPRGETQVSCGCVQGGPSSDGCSWASRDKFGRSKERCC